MHIHELFEDVFFEDMDFEFKKRLDNKNTEGWSKTLAGFANNDGGIMFVGVDDDGNVQGLTINEIDQTKLLIQKEIERHFSPHINLSFKARNIDDSLNRFVMAVEVKSSDALIEYKVGDYNRLVFIRKDAQTVPASPKEIVDLTNKKKSRALDAEFLDEDYRPEDFKKFFTACKTYRNDEKMPHENSFLNIEAITQEGKLTFGASLFKDLSNRDETLITCHLYAGFEKDARVLDVKSFKGNLIDEYEFMKKFILKNTRSGYEKMKNGGQKAVVSYPSSSIDEALINSLAHRDYSIKGTQIDIAIFPDRIDIYTPGSWLLNKKASKYDWSKMPSIRRNKIICDMFTLAGLMEKGGTGFRQMHKDYSPYPDKFPIFESYGDFSILTLFDLTYDDTYNRRPELSNGIFDATLRFEDTEIPFKEVVLEFCSDTPKTRKQIQALTTYSSPQTVISKIINPLVRQHLLVSTNPTTSPKQKYITNKKLYHK